jgi:hypothetical protein
MEITAQNESERGAQLYPITARSAELASRCQQPTRKGSAVLRNGAGMLVSPLLVMSRECNVLDMYSKQWRIARSGRTI